MASPIAAIPTSTIAEPPVNHGYNIHAIVKYTELPFMSIYFSFHCYRILSPANKHYDILCNYKVRKYVKHVHTAHTNTIAVTISQLDHGLRRF